MFQASLNNQSQSNTVVKKGSAQTVVVRPTATVSSVPVSQPSKWLFALTITLFILVLES